VRSSRSLPIAVALASTALAIASPGGALARHASKQRATSACKHHTRVHHSSRGCVASLHRASVRAARRHHHRAAHAAPAAAAQNGAARAEAIAHVLATQCENTQITPAPSNIEAARAAVLCLINRQRAAASELPLREDARLQAAAESHVNDLIAADYFAHVSPTGVTPVDRIRSTGYIPSPESGYLIGENLAWGTLSLSTPQAIVEAWMNSPEHRANILEGSYLDTGVALAASVPASLSEGEAGATYAQEFGTITG
jgi:uncharacterized protein YkwD